MNDTPQQSRRKFLQWGAGAAAGLGFFSFSWFFRRKAAPPQTAKMLDRDGRLVEVDLSRAKKTNHKASSAEIREWIRR